MTLSHQFDLTADLGKQFNQVAKLINVSDTLDTERGAYYVSLGSFDTHSDVGAQLQNNFEQIDNALHTFELEMKAQGRWDDVVKILGPFHYLGFKIVEDIGPYHECPPWRTLARSTRTRSRTPAHWRAQARQTARPAGSAALPWATRARAAP